MVAAIILWNIVYLERVVRLFLSKQGKEMDKGLLRQAAPVY